jgi:ribosomal protein S18 acetylase RimI-like enzyme
LLLKRKYKVMLIKAIATDFDFFYSLYMHPQVNPFLLYEVMEKELFKPIFDDLLKQQVLYKFNDGTTGAGMCKLVLHRYRDSHKMYVGGLAIHPLHTGKGYGVLLMQEIISFAKANNRSRVDLTVSTENEKAIALYKKCGFVIEGLLKNYSYLASQNRFVDEYLMCYLQNNKI